MLAVLATICGLACVFLVYVFVHFSLETVRLKRARKLKTGSAVMKPVTVVPGSTSKLQQARLKNGSKHNTTDD